MLIEIWITQQGQYNFYQYYHCEDFFVLKNNEFEGIYDSLEEAKHYTVDFDNRFGDGTFDFDRF